MGEPYKRKHQQKPGGKYSVDWKNEHGKRQVVTAFVDKAKSKVLQANLQHEADLIRKGLMDPRDKSAAHAARVPIAIHAADYAAWVRGKGGGEKHCKQVQNEIIRLLAAAKIKWIAEITETRVRPALTALSRTKSPSTANHAMVSIKAFVRWLDKVGRLKSNPLRDMTEKYNEEAGRKRVRRVLRPDQLKKLLEAAEKGDSRVASRPHKSKNLDVMITGWERANLYLLAMGTGFRAGTLRKVQPEDFIFDEKPRIEIDGSRFKNGKSMRQPIRKDLAEIIKPWIKSLEVGKPIMAIPQRTADMLKADLAIAKIPYEDERGHVIDFHALRHSFITAVGKSGTDPKTMMELAGHQDFKTTQRYLHSDDDDKRKALGE